MEDLFRMLAKDGGKIISSNDCNELEIAQARACRRMWVNSEGFGFIWFPKQD